MQLTGAEIIIETLKSLGVDTVFGYPGGTVITVYDALYRRGEGIRHILTSHEQGAAHAADGYARSTGKTGVCLVTSGPGATNLVTGIATAYMDSVPLVAITINVATAKLGKDSFQEVDIAGVTMPVTKHNFIVRDINSLEETLRRAFRIAAGNRPGPVLVDITKDVTREQAEYIGASQTGYPDKRNECLPDKAAIKEFLRLLQKAHKPVIIAGGGCVISRASKQLAEFVGYTGIPVADTLMGKGAFPGNRGEYLGMVGLYGTNAANRAVREADLVIALGMRFSERVTANSPDFAAQATIIHVDIDSAEINKNVRADFAITGDIRQVLDAVNARLKDTVFKKKQTFAGFGEKLVRESAADRNPDPNAENANMNAGNAHPNAENADCSSARDFSGLEIARTVSARAGNDIIVATEVGLNQMWAATGFVFTRPGQLLTSGGLGTMGYGLGAAIGAAAGNPGIRVINFAGDGSFRMNMNELLTAVRYRLPITEIIIDNSSLGMVHQLQHRLFEERYSETEFTDKVNYAAVSLAMGAAAFTVQTMEELTEALQKALKCEGPSVIVCKTERNDEFVFA